MLVWLLRERWDVIDNKGGKNFPVKPETCFSTLQINSRPLLSSFCESHSVASDSLRPHGLRSPWNSPGQNTGAGSLSLLQGIVPTQGSNLGLPHCRWIFLPAEPHYFPDNDMGGPTFNLLSKQVWKWNLNGSLLPVIYYHKDYSYQIVCYPFVCS